MMTMADHYRKLSDGREKTKEGIVPLCRCSASNNKPCCDGRHRERAASKANSCNSLKFVLTSLPFTTSLPWYTHFSVATA